MYKDFIHIFVLSCAKATYLIEKRLHRKLNPIERLQLRMHLSLCRYCSDYNKKAELLDKLTRISVSDNEKSTVFTADEVEMFKKRVCEKINS